MFYLHVKDPTTAEAEQPVRTRVHLEPGHRAINLKINIFRSTLVVSPPFGDVFAP